MFFPVEAFEESKPHLAGDLGFQPDEVETLRLNLAAQDLQATGCFRVIL